MRGLSAACAIVLALVPLVPLVSGQAAKTEKVQGYAEWRHDGDLIVDGQRLVADGATKLKGKGVPSFDAIPLGYEVEAEGVRRADGRVVAATVTAKANGVALFEKEIRSATDSMEAKWLADGAVSEETSDGRKVIGKTVESGADVARARRILTRVTPPYVAPGALRLHVVETKEWNAMAMGNGAVWVYTGLLHEMNDSEVGFVVAHEVAHYTHEHSRKSFKRGMWLQLALLGVAVAAESVDDDKAKAVIGLAGVFSLTAIKSGYGRDLEDQADRVGLRYAYEGGFDPASAPRLWERFRAKYGDQNRVVNFFLGDHSTSSARIRNLNREIALNYQGD
jgi:Zn-dependent protease with chaperone function